MSRRLISGAALCLAMFTFEAPVAATPGTYHTVVGSGAEYEPGACTGQFYCGAAHGSTFAIDASDQPGAHGWMRLNDVHIALTCVTVTHEQNGHWLYASGAGMDGKPYFASVAVPIAAGSFIIGNHPGSRPCGGLGYWSTSGYGTFAVGAHP